MYLHGEDLDLKAELGGPHTHLRGRPTRLQPNAYRQLQL